ncbi:MAG TPA: hypothetical protein PKI59_00890 [Candidatus Cloacimonadota bacterium]|nr:hypothetical protein [Candidatus Cloacimonadota bacterium]
MLDWIADMQIKTIALVGISKNSGKTTMLNYIIQSHPKLRWGVMTTGIDGEDKDVIFKTPKPKVMLGRGHIFCCDSKTLDAHGSRVTVLSGTQSAGRKLWLAEAQEPLETEITGPSAVSAQISVARAMQRHNAQKVLIDGSLDRKSIALEPDVHALILALGASYGNIAGIVQESSRLKALAAIPACKLSPYAFRRLLHSPSILIRQKSRWTDTGLTSLIGHERKFLSAIESQPQAVYIPGAYTASLHKKLGKTLALADTVIVFRHPECIKLQLQELRDFLATSSIQCLIPFRIKAFALNSWSPTGAVQDAVDFREQLRQAFPGENLIDIREIG